MWELDHKEGWALKNWCFWTVVLEKTLEGPLDCKEIKTVHPKEEISPEYSLEGLMLKLKLQYFGHVMWRADSLEKTLIWERLKVGGEGYNRGWDGWMAPPTQGTGVWANCRRWWTTGRLARCGPRVRKEPDTSERLGNDNKITSFFLLTFYTTSPPSTESTVFRENWQKYNSDNHSSQKNEEKTLTFLLSKSKLQIFIIYQIIFFIYASWSYFLTDIPFWHYQSIYIF